MKKFMMTLALVLGFAVAASAQSKPRAIGLNLGWGADISYQHSLSKDFIELDLGLYTFDSINASCVYNFMIAQPNWTDRGEWGFYAGPGVALGMGFGDDDNYFHLAVAGQIGLEYTFWFPLQLSIDLRPTIGYSFGNHLYWGVCPALGIRYRF